MEQVVVVIPTLNEAKNISQAIQSVQVQGGNPVVCVVDGGSNDDTVEQAKRAGAKAHVTLTPERRFNYSRAPPWWAAQGYSMQYTDQIVHTIPSQNIAGSRLSSSAPLQVLSSPHKGRGLQMNLGWRSEAQDSTRAWFLFLHGDSVLPEVGLFVAPHDSLASLFSK
eukprot:1159448-Pelagomonas_calceolata.AAC.3